MNIHQLTCIKELFINYLQIKYWRFEVIYSWNEIISSSSINFLRNTCPSNGICTINPSNGTIYTLFTISCSNWYDKDKIKDYSIYFWTTDYSKKTIIGFSFVSQFHIRLPSFHIDLSLIHLIIEIRDRFDCITQQNLSSINILHSNNNLITNSLFHLLSFGNQNHIGQIITIFSQQLNLFSSNLTNLSLKQINTFAYLREELINKINFPFYSELNSIKLQLSILVQLTQITNQLTRTTSKCDDLTHVLYSISKDILYEDLQQGIISIAQCTSNVFNGVNGILQQQTKPLDLDKNHLYTYYIDNYQTFNKHLIIFGLKELTLNETEDYCSNKTIDKLSIYSSACYYLDKYNQWQSDGLLVGPKTNHYQVQWRVTALELAKLQAHVIVGIRGQERAERVAQELSKESHGNVIGYHLDLSDLSSVKAFAEKIDEVDILINNAGVVKQNKELTKDGLESTFGTNHTYGDSKLANILHVVELQRRYGDRGIKAYSLHPGVIISTNLGGEKTLLLSVLAASVGFFSRTIAQGAMTTLYCALSDEAQPGKYHSNCRVAQPSSIAYNWEKAQELWDFSEQILNEKAKYLKNFNTDSERFEIQKKLKRAINHFKIFDDLDECVDYLTDLENQIVMLIISDASGPIIIPAVNDFPQLKAIYVYSVDKKMAEEWTKENKKIKGVYKHFKDIITAVLIDRQVHEHIDSDPVMINVYSTQSTGNTSEERDSKNAVFMYFQLLIDILLQMSNDQNLTAKQELIDHFKRIYENDEVIEELENRYQSEQAIWWYSRPSFLYSTLNKALRESDYEVLLALRFFINDLYQQLKYEHQKILDTHNNNDDDPILKVYRGQSISTDELSYIRKNVGQYISMQSFLSTSVDRPTGLFFAQASAIPSLDTTRILFQFNINTHMTNIKPYVNIKNLSYFPDEDEVLITLGSIFKIDQIEYNENEEIWIGILSLCNEDEYELKELMKQMKDEISEGIGSLGWLLYNQGEYEKGMNYFQQVLLESTIDDFDRLQCYQGLGAIYIALQNYDQALQNFQKALELSSKDNDTGSNAPIYAKIGEIYFFKKEFDLSLFYEQKALDIFLPLNNPELSDVYRTMAHIYYEQNNFNLVLEHYEKALEVDHQHLPENHYNFGITYESMGSDYHNIRNYRKAVECFTKARDVYLKSLPPNHSRILILEETDNFVEYIVIIVGLNHDKNLYDDLTKVVKNDRIKSFEDIETSLPFIQSELNKDIFLIISGTLGEECINRIVHEMQTVAVRCTTSDLTKLIRQLHQDIKEFSSRWPFEEKSFEKSWTFSSQWYHLFLYVICNRSESITLSYHNMFKECREYYKNNSSMIRKIDRFAQQYQSSNAIQEYTRDSFLYRISVHSRFTLSTIYMEKEELIRSVYRGQYLSVKQLDHLRSVWKTNTPIITLTTFSSTSLDPDVASNFASAPDNLISCLFEIIIPDSYNHIEKDFFPNKQVFANISSLSDMPEEREVLFSLVTHFRIKNIEHQHNHFNHSWLLITLELAMDEEIRSSFSAYSIIEELEKLKDSQIYHDILDMLEEIVNDEMKFNNTNWTIWWNNLKTQWDQCLKDETPLNTKNKEHKEVPNDDHENVSAADEMQNTLELIYQIFKDNSTDISSIEPYVIRICRLAVRMQSWYDASDNISTVTNDGSNNRSLSLYRYEKYMHEWILLGQLKYFLLSFHNKFTNITTEFLLEINRLMKKLDVLISICTIYICIESDSNEVNVDNIQFINMSKIQTTHHILSDFYNSELIAALRVTESESSITHNDIPDNKRIVPTTFDNFL
ncbi:hypothetical protein I4U23_011249 [Adineta vaga]|nr:hypothetical protein I4U23_011249 [Adineta vaga]